MPQSKIRNPKSKIPMRKHPLILPVYAPTLLLAFCRGMLIPVLPVYAKSFDISYGLIGLILGAQGLGTLVGDLPSGILLGRLGQKRSMILGIAGMALSALALFLAGSYWELVIYNFALGFTSALWNISRHAYLASAIPITQRGQSIAVFGGINRIGTFGGPVIGGLIGASFGLSMPFLVYGIIAALCLVFPIVFTEVPVDVDVVRRGGVKGHTGHLWTILRDHYRVLLPAGSGQIFAQMIRSARSSIIPLYAADILGLDLTAIGLIISISSAIDMSLFYPAGLLMDRVGRKFAYVPSFIVQGIGMGMIPLMGPAAGFGGLLLASCVIGFGNGLGSGTMMTLGADLSPKESMGEFLGIWRLIGDTGATGGPLAVGAIADMVGLGPTALIMGGVGLLAAATLGLLVPETLKRPKSGAT